MLRQRRSYGGPPVSDKPTAVSRRKHARIKPSNKLKMSPFPEVEGEQLCSPRPLRDIKNHHLNKLSDVKKSLYFVDVEEASSVLSSPATNPFNTNTEPINEALPISDDTLNTPPSNNSLSTPVPAINDVINSQPASDHGCHDLPRNTNVSMDTFANGNLRPTYIVSLDRKLSPKPFQQYRAIKNTGKSLNRSKSSKDGATKVNQAIEQPSAHAKSMWNSVVSWMKMAVDFIALDSTIESLPTTMPHGKKRGLGDADVIGPSAMKQPRTSSVATTQRSSRKESHDWKCGNEKRGMSLGKFRAPAGMTTDDGLGQVLTLGPIKEDLQFCSNDKMTASHSKFETEKPPFSSLAKTFSSSLSIISPRDKSRDNRLILHPKTSNFGLNSILDGSPCSVPILGSHMKKKIRRQSLRRFYGNSIYSPNLTEVPSSSIVVRRSPRLLTKGSPHVSGIPPPPPLPPVPCVPLPPPLPPPHNSSSSLHTTSFRDHSTSHAGNETGSDHSRDILNQMQSRLRNRITRRGTRKDGGSVRGGDLNNGDTKEVDIKVKQWAEIQAHSHKLSLSDFFSLAEKKRAELRTALERLEGEMSQDLEYISQTVELLLEGALWFPGGSKEMRETLPLYKKLEKKIETLNEYVQVCDEMRKAVESCPSSLGSIHYSELYNTLVHIREVFYTRHKHWGTIISTNAELWTKCGLPVCHTLLARSCNHVCGLVNRFVSLCLEEASRLTGILVSIKCTRTTQLKEKLRECLNLLIDAHFYFTLDSSDNTCYCKQCVSTSTGGSTPNDSSSPTSSTPNTLYSQSSLLHLAAKVVVSYVSISLQQFDGFIHYSNRQSVCEHFEGTLKMMSLVKSLLSTFANHKEGVFKTTGVVALLPDEGALEGVLYDSCVKLIQYIVGWAQPHMAVRVSPLSREKRSKEVALCMMFGCKYISQTLEFLGSELADKRGVVDLLTKLQQMEDSLLDYY